MPIPHQWANSKFGSTWHETWLSLPQFVPRITNIVWMIKLLNKLDVTIPIPGVWQRFVAQIAHHREDLPFREEWNPANCNVGSEFALTIPTKTLGKWLGVLMFVQFWPLLMSENCFVFGGTAHTPNMRSFGRNETAFKPNTSAHKIVPIFFPVRSMTWNYHLQPMCLKPNRFSNLKPIPNCACPNIETTFHRHSIGKKIENVCGGHGAWGNERSAFMCPN